ncbi:MAG: cation:proton antiporter [Deltaproteobacteria bacterium]|nr:cation:proton antiporter [Deltaproteobacteria bacterium]
MLISLGCIFLAALAFDAIGRRTRLPRVTLLLVFGFAIGPSGLDALPEMTGAWFPAVADIALLMIGFLLGGRLTRSELRERGRLVIGFSVVVVTITFAVMALGLFAIGVTPVVVGLLLAAIATATDPAAVMDVVHGTRAKTPFARALLAIVAIDDVWGLIIFSVALAVGLLVQGDAAAAVVMHAAWDLGGALLLGVGLGIPMAYLTGRVDPGEPSLFEALGLVFLCGGLARWLDVSFLLSAVALGTTVTNLARHHIRPFHAIEGIEWPFMILFFVLAGAALDLSALAHIGPWFTAYIVLRIAGRLAGGWLGGCLPPADANLRRWMGIALLPQAGVALGMALVASQRFPEAGEVVLPVIIASTIFFEVLGPIATRFALDRTAAGDER